MNLNDFRDFLFEKTIDVWSWTEQEQQNKNMCLLKTDVGFRKYELSGDYRITFDKDGELRVQIIFGNIPMSFETLKLVNAFNDNVPCCKAYLSKFRGAYVLIVEDISMQDNEESAAIAVRNFVKYLNNEDFVRPAKTAFRPTAANKAILADKDPNFRVMNFTVSPFNDASTSYFHKSIGGYHGAKMKRYQELIDSCLAQRNQEVYNMLNTKYYIIPDKNNQPVAQRNFEALGNAWFVESVHMVPNADTEIQSLKDFNPAKEAFVDMRFEVKNRDCIVDSTASIQLESYSPMNLVYTSKNSHDGVAIFSEIFYDKGWNAYIDEKLVPYFRANYVLRGLEIPAGTHSIAFKFEPKGYYTSNTVSLICSLILLIGFVAAVVLEIKKHLTNTETKEA